MECFCAVTAQGFGNEMVENIEGLLRSCSKLLFLDF